MAKYFRRTKTRRTNSENIHDDNHRKRRDDDSDPDFHEWRKRWRHTGKVLGIIVAVITAVLGWIASIASLFKE